MRYLLFSLSFFALIFSGCAQQEGRTVKTEIPASPEGVADRFTEPSAEPEPQAILIKEIRPAGKKRKILKPGGMDKKTLVKTIRAERGKKVFEFVRIGDELYPVPPVWRGAKIAEKSPAMSQLSKIPVDFTFNESKLYVEHKTRNAFVAMAEKALEDDVQLVVHSGFRSVAYQRRIFQKLMMKGRTWEDLVRYVAPPGYSEHAMGTVVDLYPSDWRFAGTRQYAWLKENGAFFGFFETYPESSPKGFPWEAWHWRFIGEQKPENNAEGNNQQSADKSSLQGADDNIQAKKQQ